METATICLRAIDNFLPPRGRCCTHDPSHMEVFISSTMRTSLMVTNIFTGATLILCLWRPFFHKTHIKTNKTVSQEIWTNSFFLLHSSLHNFSLKNMFFFFRQNQYFGNKLHREKCDHKVHKLIYSVKHTTVHELKLKLLKSDIKTYSAEWSRSGRTWTGGRNVLMAVCHASSRELVFKYLAQTVRTHLPAAGTAVLPYYSSSNETIVWVESKLSRHFTVKSFQNNPTEVIFTTEYSRSIKY